MIPSRTSRRGLPDNAYLKDGLCYTEDDILVYNLYVSHVPKNMNENDVEEFFSQYGELSSVNIQVRKGTNQPDFISGYIHFKNASSAGKVLEYFGDDDHDDDELRMRVKPADSWLQPRCKEQDNEQSPSKEVDIEENLILKLNDDCLLHIFSLLSLKEQIKLSTLCERFQIILGMQMRRRKSIHISNMQESFTLMEIRELVTHFGNYIEEAKLERQPRVFPNKRINYSRFLQFIIHSCRYLRRLKMFKIYRIRLDIYSKLSTNLKYLTKLELISCGINDEMCNYLSQLPILDFLDLTGSYDLKGKYLSNFSKLTQLILDACESIEPEYFSNLCKKGLLKSLHVRGCCKLNKKSFEEMESNLDELTHLVIDTSYSTRDLYNIAGLRNLTRLSICCNNSVVLPIENKLFEQLVALKKNSLEELIVNSIALSNIQKEYICSMRGLRKLGLLRIKVDKEFLRKIANLSNLIDLSLADCDGPILQALGLFFEKLNNLQHLDISYCCDINTKSLHHICDKIKEAKRTTPCTLYVFRTPIDERNVSNDKYLESVPLLSVKDQKSELTAKYFKILFPRRNDRHLL